MTSAILTKVSYAIGLVIQLRLEVHGTYS